MCESQNRRVPNFSASETELLTLLVKKYSNILENKITDAVNNKLKEETWLKLTEDFNSSSGIYERSAKTLRAKYENLKKTVKHKYGEHRRSLYRTGGGPPQALSLTQEEEAIMELAGPSVEGLPARFDSDIINDHNTTTIMPNSQVVAEVVVQDTQTSNDCVINNIMMLEDKSKMHEVKAAIPVSSEVNLDITPSRFLLKHKRSTPLKRRNPESFNKTMENYSNLSMKKQEFVEAQIEVRFYTSSTEKIKQENIEHELRCAQLQNKAKQEAKEHDLRCELMLLDIVIKKRELNQ